MLISYMFLYDIIILFLWFFGFIGQHCSFFTSHGLYYSWYFEYAQLCVNKEVKKLNKNYINIGFMYQNNNLHVYNDRRTDKHPTSFI